MSEAADKQTAKHPRRPPPDQLLPDALYSWNDIEGFVRVGRATWYRRIKDKTAPQPLTIGTRCTRYRGQEVLDWIASPGTYRAAEKNEK
ncbi:helix-turn-helix transcriptional regulator [Achromobacter xylosoxidans]|uniref:helix-turn-helix transcriptional regulator n=1 Tax=Alcaligenes xylosoxydans xylosoxydans TaxID=85698 RepID=UPI003F776F5C